MLWVFFQSCLLVSVYLFHQGNIVLKEKLTCAYMLLSNLPTCFMKEKLSLTCTQKKLVVSQFRAVHVMGGRVLRISLWYLGESRMETSKLGEVRYPCLCTRGVVSYSIGLERRQINRTMFDWRRSRGKEYLDGSLSVDCPGRTLNSPALCVSCFLRSF